MIVQAERLWNKANDAHRRSVLPYLDGVTAHRQRSKPRQSVASIRSSTESAFPQPCPGNVAPGAVCKLLKRYPSPIG